MTDKTTWNADSIYDLYCTLKKGAKSKKFMYTLYFNTLEHDSSKARELGAKSEQYFPMLKKSIMKFGRIYEQTVSNLIIATKLSEKR